MAICFTGRSPQRTETGEIAVRGAQGKAMLDGERGEMGIGDKVTVHARQLQKFAEHYGVPFSWLGSPNGFTGKPVLHLKPSICNRFRNIEDARIGHQPQKGKETRPRQSDRSRAVQLLVQPFSGRAVSGRPWQPPSGRGTSDFG
jgi:hypothetical protein